MPGVPRRWPDASRAISIFISCARIPKANTPASVGGCLEGTEREFVVQESVFTRTGVDRIIKFALELAQSRPKKHLTSATKSNGISISMPFWDERFAEIAKSYPQVRCDKYHIDILTANFVQHPDWFDVVVAPEPVRRHSFDPVLPVPGPSPSRRRPTSIRNAGFRRCSNRSHGSAPDIYGKGIANPVGQIWAGSMMLEHFGYPGAAADVLRAIETVLASGPRTPDMGGNATTTDVGKAIASAIESLR